jgi:redox-sensitive bicupin YhaK (pirin superfamily)
MRIRRSDERGHANHGWLDSHHTFSFAGYFDPRHMGFSHLRVINEDRVKPGHGFGTHPHRDMEIISYVLEGGLAHRDSMGSTEVLRPGEVQVMSAGTGVTHSEFNASDTDPVHFLQIWIEPAERGTKPRYAQKEFDWESRTNTLRPIVSPDGRDDSLVIGQDAVLSSGRLDDGVSVTQTVPPGRQAWLHVVTGQVSVNGAELSTGDAAAFEEPGEVHITALGSAELLWFDLD